MTPDRSPIIAKTPVPGLYVNCGWGTGGFKATPGSAHVFAHTIAQRRAAPDQRAVQPRALPRPAAHRRSRRRGRGALRRPAHAADRLPLSAARARSLNSATAARPTSPGPPTRPLLTDAEWARFLYERDNERGIHAERWRHTHGCARFFNALRDTATDHFLATLQDGRSPPEAV